jgi:HAD superfamily hydrolase (TIGR01509 family)
MTSIPSATLLSPPPWDHIDTVLLDLDGTLLDLAFDTWFWGQLVPEHYGASNALTPQAARDVLRPRFQAIQHTLPWYCVDYWSRELGLDIDALHRQRNDRVAWIPGAEDFLRRIRARGKRLVMATNGHPAALAAKDARVNVTRYFDAVHSSHAFGAPKEDQKFWRALREAEPYDPARTMFVDDSAPVLRAAREAGIGHIYAIRLPDSTGAPRFHEGFNVVDRIADIP